MSKDSAHTNEQIAATVRGELRRLVRMLRTDLEDLERRTVQGFPPRMTAVAVRALMMTVIRTQELAGELVGLDRSDDL